MWKFLRKLEQKDRKNFFKLRKLEDQYRRPNISNNRSRMKKQRRQRRENYGTNIRQFPESKDKNLQMGRVYLIHSTMDDTQHGTS